MDKLVIFDRHCMNVSEQPQGTRWLAVFDLDGTLTRRDTLLPYLAGFTLRHPWRVLGLWRLPAALLRFAHSRDRGELKSRCIRMLMRGATRATVTAWTDQFVRQLRRGRALLPMGIAILEAHRAAGDVLVLLSASPDLYVPTIAHELGFARAVCTEIAWHDDRLDGRLRTPNRRDQEKCRCLQQLRAEYPGLPVIAYGNSSVDLPHMRMADRALLVNANAAARRRATLLGIAVSDWAR